MNEAATTLDALETMAFALVSLTSRALAESGGRHLTFQQWRVLVVLGADPPPLRISELARRIAASGPSTSRIAQRLMRLRLVAIEPDPRDRRAVQVRLTEHGTDVRAQVVARRRDLIRDLIGASADRTVPRDAAAVVAALATAT